MTRAKSALRDVGEEMKTVHYVTYHHPGSFFDEETTRRMEVRSAKKAWDAAPRGAFAFQLWDRLEGKVNGETVRGEPRAKSGMHYLGGTVYSLEEIENVFPKHRILISNMKGNGWKHAIRCVTGNWKPVEKTDVFMPEK